MHYTLQGSVGSLVQNDLEVLGISHILKNWEEVLAERSDIYEFEIQDAQVEKFNEIVERMTALVKLARSYDKK